MNLSELKLKPLNEISTIADNLKVENVGRLKKQELLFAILKNKLKTAKIFMAMAY
jgi:transcription termination factor Rho